MIFSNFKFDCIKTIISQRKLDGIQIKSWQAWKIATTAFKEKNSKIRIADEFYKKIIFQKFVIQSKKKSIEKNEISMYF